LSTVSYCVSLLCVHFICFSALCDMQFTVAMEMT